MNLDRVLIIGASGMVGSQMPFGFRPSHAELDITDSTSIKRAMEAYAPEAVILLAGVVNVQEAENDPDNARRVNVDGARAIAQACVNADIPLIYLSSCAVFDGTKDEPYNESDTPSPINVYGETKYEAEQEILRLSPRALVIRTGWLFGGFEHDIKFIHRFYELLARGEEVRATNDRFGSPTFVPDLIQEMVRFLQAGRYGIVHVINASVASYFEVGKNIQRLMGTSTSVIGLSGRELDVVGVKRGKMEALVSNQGIQLRPYEEALAEYIDALQAQKRY